MHDKIILVGPTGSGKTSQIWTLPGRKLVYVFDPNCIHSLHNIPDTEFAEFYPDMAELDATIKGFNKGSKDDILRDQMGRASKREPTTYMRFIEDINNRVDGNKLGDISWICFDSMTFLTKAIMARQLFINNRYGSIEELGDYRVVGSKLSEVFNSIVGLTDIGIFATGHIQTFQDEKTAKVSTELRLPGQAKDLLPLMFADVWQTEYDSDKQKYQVRTKPDKRGLKNIRCSIRGLKDMEDATIDFDREPVGQGVGHLLQLRK